MQRMIWIGIFGILGVFARYLLGRATPNTPAFLTTLAINVLGSFLIGIVFVISKEKFLINADLAFNFVVGFLGGFTTFSGFSMQVFELIEARNFTTALFYSTASPVLSILATFGGVFLTRRL